MSLHKIKSMHECQLAIILAKGFTQDKILLTVGQALWHQLFPSRQILVPPFQHVSREERWETQYSPCHLQFLINPLCTHCPQQFSLFFLVALSFCPGNPSFINLFLWVWFKQTHIALRKRTGKHKCIFYACHKIHSFLAYNQLSNLTTSTSLHVDFYDVSIWSFSQKVVVCMLHTYQNIISILDNLKFLMFLH